MAGEQRNDDGDPFEALLRLEDQYHKEGYDLGVADGSRAGRFEGRIFGLQKGFEKFVEMGQQRGRTAVWQARLPRSESAGASDNCVNNAQAPTLSGSERLRRHIERMMSLTHPDTLPTENSEESVSEFDERLRDAKAKATLIAKMVGKDDMHLSSPEAKLAKSNGQLNGADEMEDFAGLPRTQK